MTVSASPKRLATLGGVALAGALSLGACSAPSVNGTIGSVFGTGFLGGQAHKIAMCESTMNPRAVSGTNDYGLFQINIVHRNSFTQVTGQPWSQVFNPYYNAVFAKRLYDQQGWRPWSCARKVL